MADATKTPMTGADILVRCLINHGVDTVFAYPGGASMPLHQSLTKVTDRVRTILHAVRLRRARQTGLVDFVRELTR